MFVLLYRDVYQLHGTCSCMIYKEKSCRHDLLLLTDIRDPFASLHVYTYESRSIHVLLDQDTLFTSSFQSVLPGGLFSGSSGASNYKLLAILAVGIVLIVVIALWCRRCQRQTQSRSAVVIGTGAGEIYLRHASTILMHGGILS